MANISHISTSISAIQRQQNFVAQNCCNKSGVSALGNLSLKYTLCYPVMTNNIEQWQ